MQAKPFFFLAACLAVVVGTVLYISQDFVERSPPEFKDAQSRWREAGVRDYDMRVEMLCFCDSRPFIVEVRDGRAMNVRLENAVDGVLEESDAELRTLTIDDAFAMIGKAYSKSSDHIQVIYDAQLGYPRRAEVDESKEGIDDEWTMTVDVRKVSHGA